jgi:hypothetical protein
MAYGLLFRRLVPGRLSLDASIGWAGGLTGVWWGVGVAAPSILATAATVRLGRRRGLRRAPQPVADDAARRAA